MGKQLSNDIRLDVGFLRNLKTIKFSRSLGGSMSDPVICMLRLWMYCSERHKKGVMEGMDRLDLEAAAGWTGMQGAFSEHAISMLWVDEASDGTLSIHDWKDHQPYIYHHDRRSEIAKSGAVARWDKKKKRIVNATSNATSNAGSNPGSNAPSPAPAPKDLKTIVFTLPPIIRPEVWQGFEEMRKRIRKPMTDHMRKLIVGKLKRLGGDPNRILEESTMNGWPGVFPLKDRDEAKPAVDCIGRRL